MNSLPYSGTFMLCEHIRKNPSRSRYLHIYNEVKRGKVETRQKGLLFKDSIKTNLASPGNRNYTSNFLKNETEMTSLYI